MSESYRAVGWNTFKRRVDLILGGSVVAFLGLYLAVTNARHPDITTEIAMMRGLAITSFVLLHLILAIGPLARLDRRLLPLLYNRRHFGVTMFTLAALHSLLATLTYHFGGDVNVFVSILSTDTVGEGRIAFPFQSFGFLALGILFLMAATSHDFWLRNLTAPVWKGLHMLVYVAYGALIVHVAFGFLQAEQSPMSFGLLGLGALSLISLHLVAGLQGRPLDKDREPDTDGFVSVCPVDQIPESRARIVCAAGERIAVFRYDGKLSAVSNACQHQNGPLGEGKIVDGCITCPWHGYQYLPDTGASPPPFSEKVPTFRVVVKDGVVFVDPRPQTPGARTAPFELA